LAAQAIRAELDAFQADAKQVAIKVTAW